MRDTGRTKEAERNIGQGGVRNQTFGSINRRNIHVGCNMIETKNSRLLHILSTPVLHPPPPPVCGLHISLPQTYQRPNLG